VKLEKADWILAVTLVAYIICDVLLTPPAGLETRNPARVSILCACASVIPTKFGQTNSSGGSPSETSRFTAGLRAG